MHCVAASNSEYLPGKQLLHVFAPLTSAYVPDLHVGQSFSWYPGTLIALPALHNLQFNIPLLFVYCPGLHNLHPSVDKPMMLLEVPYGIYGMYWRLKDAGIFLPRTLHINLLQNGLCTCPFRTHTLYLLWQNDLVVQQSNSRNFDGANTCPLYTVCRKIYQVRHCMWWVGTVCLDHLSHSAPFLHLHTWLLV